MAAEKGYYSIIQYCPDLWRGEAANVGVVLFQPESRRMNVQLSDTLARVRHFFKPNERQMAFIADAARAVRVRLTTRAADFKTVQDLEQHAETMGNDIRLTPPRVTAVTETHADLMRLSDKLVGSERHPRRQRPAVVLPSAINEAYEELKRSNRIFSPGRVVVPILGRRLDIPYAYRNGVLNMIKPTVFENPYEVEDRAIRLAVEGDFFRENPLSDGARCLIVVSAASQDLSAEDRVAPLFARYRVPFIRQSDAAAFAAKVRVEATTLE